MSLSWFRGHRLTFPVYSQKGSQRNRISLMPDCAPLLLRHLHGLPVADLDISSSRMWSTLPGPGPTDLTHQSHHLPFSAPLPVPINAVFFVIP